ncbi:hypothetical protein F4778DRAFT_10299 [Xylariomycetidae sp. FL2044]|nr:hypothetical protein F4778DRAFT_10299 [Xylariomycetidae sp. FL2044]
MSLSPPEIQYYQAHASDTKQPAILASQTVTFVLAYIFVGLRIWARQASKASFGPDDWLIVAALVPLTAYAVVGYLQVSWGEGRHIIFLTNAEGFVQGYVAVIVAYAVCVVLTKLSVLCFYQRIFSPMKRLYHLSWGFGVFIVAYNLALVFVTAFECVPLSSMWTGAPGKCFDTLPPFTTLGIVNVVADVGILALPIRYIIQLNLPLTRRIQVCGIFLLGALVCVFGIVRVVALAQAPPGDASYNQVDSGIWSFCEIAVGIVAACLPTLAVLATRSHLSRVSSSVRHLLSTTFRRSSPNHGSGSNFRSGNNTRMRIMMSSSTTPSAHNRSGNSSRRGGGARISDDTQLSELSLTKGASLDDWRARTSRGDGDVSPYVAGSLAERGEGEVPVVKREVV